MMSLVGTRYAAARRRQTITLASRDTHAFRVVVDRGPVQFRIGSIPGEQDVMSEETLGTGTHVLAFTPTVDIITIEVSHKGYQAALVSSIDLQAAGELVLESPYPADALPLVRFDQSGDVVYLACRGYQQRKIVRRAAQSWSIELFEPVDGPFRGLNVTATTLTASATNGDITLTASADVFKEAHVGALFRIESIGQQTNDTFTGDGQFSDPIRVSGVGDARKLTSVISGTWSGTLKLQRSIGEPGLWQNVEDHPGNGTADYNDGFDNQIIYYRMGFATGGYTSGSAVVQLTYASGSNTGVVKITRVDSPSLAAASVLSDLGSTDATENWYEGAWSDERGWPSAVRLYEGRLWFAGLDKLWGSVSDEYESFDRDFAGDAGPISKTIGSGPVDSISWMLGLQRMVLGGAGAEHSVRSSSLDEPLTATNCNIKEATTQGTAPIGALRVDSTGIFAQREGRRLYELEADETGVDYQAVDLTILAPEINKPGIAAIAVQRQPDTRIHVVRTDGVAALLVYDRAENVRSWINVKVGDLDADTIVDVVVLPDGDNAGEDKVYYVVNVNGNYRLTRWALEEECRGGTLNKQADLFKVYEGAAISTMTGLDHLNDRSVVVWADGKVLSGTFTVSGGSISLGATYSSVVAGLYYEARYKSAKLVTATARGNSLFERKKVQSIAAMLAYTHQDGLYYGPDFDNLDPLPDVERMEKVGTDDVWETYDSDEFEFAGDWDTDSRICLWARAPYPATVIAIKAAINTSGVQ